MARPFKLEAVLNHRRHREEAARKRYADAQRQLRQAQDKLTAIEMMRQEYRQDLQHRQRQGGEAAQIVMWTHYLARLDKEIRSQEDIVRARRKEKETQRQVLMTALKDRKVIEKLKEHHTHRLEAEERGREQKLLNDVAIARYQRRARDA